MVAFGVCGLSVELRSTVIDAFEQRFLFGGYVNCGVTKYHRLSRRSVALFVPAFARSTKTSLLGARECGRKPILTVRQQTNKRSKVWCSAALLAPVFYRSTEVTVSGVFSLERRREMVQTRNNGEVRAVME